MRLHRTLLVAGTSLLALSLAAKAQDDATALEAIVVTGAPDPTAPAGGFVATGQASATKTGTARIDTQQTTSVVTSEQITAQGARTLGQALNYSAGTFGEPYGQDSRGDAPRLRGFDGGNSQFLNGLKLLRSNTTPSFETYGLERIEVLHGPAGVLYGAGNPGGMINMIQKRAQFDTFNEVGLSFGTDDRAETFFDLNRTVGTDVAYRFTGVLRSQTGAAEEIEDDRIYLAPSVTWQINGEDTLTFLGSYQWDNPEQPTSVSTDALIGGSDAIGRDTYIGEEDYNHSDRKQVNLGVEWQHRFNDNWSLTQGLRYQSFDWDYQWLYFSSLTGDTINRGAIEQDEDTETVNLDTRLTGHARTGAVDHTLLFGLDIRRYDELTQTAFGRGVPGLSASDPQYGATVDPEIWYEAENDLTYRQTGIYAQDELRVDRWRATLGLRHDWSSREGTTYSNFAGTTDVDEDTSETTGRAGLSYVFDNGFAPFVSYATTFDPVVGTDELTGDPLDPTSGRQWEVGVKYQPAGFDGFFTATLFDIEQKNVTVSVLDSASGVVTSRQRGQVDSKGLELEGVAQLSPAWTLRAAYSYTDAETVSDDYAGLVPENTPEDVASLWVGYDFDPAGPLAGLNLGGGIRYFGARFGDAANTYRMDGETLLDASVSYVHEAVTARVTVQNLTDEEYLAQCGSFGCTYGAGRTVIADVSYRW
ncbi:TonB-dependent siderophore receptor [Falsirhodobacter algicola]|uniref:TonB-dependent siderophore receptor n=1 Tax=Falsirhodobacter algicola TaxID=2692330 RepID=A0A8J8SLC4_9RHOB|nr:TonB-dependent siderophore receptor [Falsirhodobacter algicola]QUS36236.1 TonB-dependent siderophore receptor [Falsirhodobacter algicola]